jgi:hypothetical protein
MDWQTSELTFSGTASRVFEAVRLVVISSRSSSSSSDGSSSSSDAAAHSCTCSVQSGTQLM